MKAKYGPKYQYSISLLLHCGMNVTFLECLKHSILCTAHQHYHGLRTPNEGINQRNLKCLGRMWQTNILWLQLKNWVWGVILSRDLQAISLS